MQTILAVILCFDGVKMTDGSSEYKMKATAIIMAGGKSTRMGSDKSMLPINGMPAIKHLIKCLQPHFDHVIISSSNISRHSFQGVLVVKDSQPGKGPLMGIFSALRASRNDVNFVIACDIPEVDIDFVRRMVAESHDVEAVVPQTGPTHYEPLFAVYKKAVLTEIEKSIGREIYKIMHPIKKCKVRYIRLPDNVRITNLNTMQDYCEFLNEKK